MSPLDQGHAVALVVWGADLLASTGRRIPLARLLGRAGPIRPGDLAQLLG